MEPTNVNQLQTRTSPFGYYATHKPCDAVLTAQYHPTGREAYADALLTLRAGAHECREDAETNPDGREYEYACIRSVFCDAEDDTHSVTCERVNDHGRSEFYADVVRDDLRAML